MTWTRPLLEELKAAIAGKPKDEVILFYGSEVLVAYGRYLVEYLEGQLA